MFIYRELYRKSELNENCMVCRRIDMEPDDKCIGREIMAVAIIDEHVRAQTTIADCRSIRRIPISRSQRSPIILCVHQRRRRASGGPRSKLEVVLLVLDRSKRIAVGMTRARGPSTPLPLCLSLSFSFSFSRSLESSSISDALLVAPVSISPAARSLVARVTRQLA